MGEGVVTDARGRGQCADVVIYNLRLVSSEVHKGSPMVPSLLVVAELTKEVG